MRAAPASSITAAGGGVTCTRGTYVSGLLVAVTVWPAVLYAALVLVVVTAIIVLSSLLGERSRSAGRSTPYESGIKPAGPLPKRLSVEFYQVALFFVVFDLEAVFIFAWAVNSRRLGWTGYLEMVVFVGLLFAGLVYLWKTGGLDWGAAGRRRRQRRRPATAAPAPRPERLGEEGP
jgi:NADH-quinone oxidoreductase subunit A